MESADDQKADRVDLGVRPGQQSDDKLMTAPLTRHRIAAVMFIGLTKYRWNVVLVVVGSALAGLAYTLLS
jgi:hypothetical protein